MPLEPHRAASDAASITPPAPVTLDTGRPSAVPERFGAARNGLLQDLRTIVLDDPDPTAGITEIGKHLSTAAGDPSWRTWLEILLAEAHQHHGGYWAAGKHLLAAAEQARTSKLAHQALVIAGVSADIAVCDRQPGAINACIEYIRDAYPSVPVEPVEQATQRFALANVLHAIALYQHQSCQEGREKLSALLPLDPDVDRTPKETDLVVTVKAALQPMVTATITAMDNGCRPSCLLPPAPLPPLPGGALRPQLLPIPVDFGASRVAPPGIGPRKVTHTCGHSSGNAP